MTDAEKIAIYDHLHQPGEITQEFAEAVYATKRVELDSYTHGWVLLVYRAPGYTGISVTTITQVLRILDAFEIEVDWPRGK